jgi:hypothetical protein
LSSWLIPNNLDIKICKIIILFVFLYGYDAWLFTLREEHELRENIWTEEEGSDGRLEKTA